MLGDSDVVQKKSNAHPSDGSTAAGGAKTTTLIDNSTVGEWFPRLKANLSGDLDDDAVKQFQKCFVCNESATDSLENAKVFLLNGLKLPAGPGLITIQSTDADDDSDNKVVCWGENSLGNVLGFDNIICNGTTLSSAGMVTFERLFRCKLVDSATGLIPQIANGNISIFLDGELIGFIPQGYTFATGEIKLWLPATVNDSGTSTNRFIAPSGSTFTLATTEATGIYIRNNSSNATLGPTQGQGVWGECTLQPAMEAFNGVDVVLAAVGDGT